MRSGGGLAEPARKMATTRSVCTRIVHCTMSP